MKTAVRKSSSLDPSSKRRAGNRNQPSRFSTGSSVSLTCDTHVQSKSTREWSGGWPRCQNALPVQPKLKTGQPNDKYEQEADRVAEQVMRMPGPQVQAQAEEEEEELIQTKPVADQISPLIQRQIEPEEEEEEELLQAKLVDDAQVQRQEEEEEEEEEPVQTKRVSGKTASVGQRPASQVSSLRGSGRPLPRSVRNFYEPRFGYDFSKVRIYADSGAAEAARTLNAKAYTHGRDIVFGAGQYAPGTRQGRQLLAHELTHVVQQTGDKIECKLTIGQPGDKQEQEAEWGAEQVIWMPEPRVQRQPKEEAKRETEEEKLKNLADDLLKHFNYEINNLQLNLGIVENVLNMKDIPKADFAIYFRNRILSEALEAIPNKLVAEGLKILWDVYTTYEKADEEAEAARRYNDIQQFAATSKQDLLDRQEHFAWLHDKLIKVAKSGNEQMMMDTLKKFKTLKQKPLTDINKQGLIYRQSLHESFIIKKGLMKVLVYSHRKLRHYLLGDPESWIERMVESGSPRYYLLKRKGKKVRLIGWHSLTLPHISNLLTLLDMGGAGFTRESLYFWWRDEADVVKKKFRRGFPRDTVLWVFSP